MSDLSEYRERVAEVIRVECFYGGLTEDRRDYERMADALLAPGGVVAEIVAASTCPLTEHDGTHGPLIRQAKAEGAAEVRARVEALVEGPTSDGCRPYALEIDGEINLVVLLDDLRAALANERGPA
jgi:hypothetical protein